GLDDLVELGTVVRDQADAFDDHVVHQPAVARLVHPVLDRDLAAALGDELGLHLGLIALDRVAVVGDLLAAVRLDLAYVRALQQVAEELDELVPLGRGAALPVTAQRATGGLAEVEDIVSDLADGRPAVLGAPLFLELGILERLDDAIDLRLQLVGRHSGHGPAVRQEGDRQRQDQREDDEGTARPHTVSLHFAEDILREELFEVHRRLHLADASVGRNDLVGPPWADPDELLADQSLRLDGG